MVYTTGVSEVNFQCKVKSSRKSGEERGIGKVKRIIGSGNGSEK